MKIIIGAILTVLCAQPLLALDFNADYPRIPTPLSTNSGFFAGLAAQGTYFNTTQLNGHPALGHGGIPAPIGEQYLTSITSEPFFGYNFSDRIGLQLELPVIYREYEAIQSVGNAIRLFNFIHGSQFGLGDIRLLGNFALVKMDTPDFAVDWNATAGIKFPTGNADQLSKTNFPFGITRADLALGSGSYDGIIGTDVSLRWCRFFATAETRYSIRSEGAFDYQYANDLSWYGGPGAYLVRSDDSTLSLQAIVSGDTKGKDTAPAVQHGSPVSVGDTGETGIYLGPQINFTWRDEVSAQLGADLPVSIVTTGIQIVPTYRIRAAVTVWF
ncbi:MAG TPA: hypothetical protein VKV04_04960 [Verrucomicrobiae bacterium]|nr:hypothetical protein [Verrucomicrobiae bacterium]